MFRAANSRAVVGRSLCRASATRWAIAFQKFWIGGFQNLPISVCSAVRVVLDAEPRLSTSLSAVAYPLPVSAGGGAGRNWSPRSSTNGVTCPHVVKAGAGKFAGDERWCRRGRSVAGPDGEQIAGNQLADADALVLGRAVPNLRQLGRIGGVEHALLARIQADQRRVRSRVGGRSLRGRAWRPDRDQVGVVAAVD